MWKERGNEGYSAGDGEIMREKFYSFYHEIKYKEYLCNSVVFKNFIAVLSVFI